MLKRLQFLFKLPNQLKSLVQENNFKKVSTKNTRFINWYGFQSFNVCWFCYIKAVEDFKQAEQVLIQYGDLDSFTGIREDCEKTVLELRAKLHEQLNTTEVIIFDYLESNEADREVPERFLGEILIFLTGEDF